VRIFANDQDKVYWVLSYMKSSCAALCVDRTLRYESATGTPRFPSWSDFRMLFITSFYPQNKPAIARFRLESNLYFQGNRTVNEYCDEFEDLLERSGYMEDLTAVMKFRRGLDRDIQDKIAESGVGCPSNSDPMSWYDAAKRLDQNRIANEVFNSSVHPTATPDLSSPATPTTPAAIQLPLTKRPEPFNVRCMPVNERHALLEELLVLRWSFQSKRKPAKATQTMRQTLSTPLPHSRNRYHVLPVDVIEETSVSSRESELNVLDTPLAPAMSPSDVRNVKLPSWERCLPRKYIVASTPGGNSLSIDVDIQCTESGIRRATQSLVDCGATGIFMDEQWVKDNSIVT
jgi:hypothetical protein